MKCHVVDILLLVNLMEGGGCTSLFGLFREGYGFLTPRCLGRGVQLYSPLF